MAKFRNRTAAVDGGVILEVWWTVETVEGNAVAGVDGVFDHPTEESALKSALALAVEANKPLSVVGNTRDVLGTYAAVTKVEKV